jgi:hypothetical protein
VVVDRSQIEAETDLKGSITEELPHVVSDLIEAVDLFFVREEHVGVNLMNEDLVWYALIDGTAGLDDVSQTHTVRLVILWLSIDDVDEWAASLDSSDILRRSLLQLIITWVVLDCELDEGIVVND